MRRFIFGTFINRPARSSRLISSAVESLEPRRLLSVTFGPPESLVGGFGAGPVVVADLNGDGKPDIVEAQSSDGYNVQSIAIFVNQGDGTFGAPIYLPYSASQLGGLAVGDFNGDGVPDIVVGSPNGTVTCYLGAGTNVNGTDPAFLAPVVSSATAALTDAATDAYGMGVQTAHFGGTMDDLVAEDNDGFACVMLATGGGHFETGTANMLVGPNEGAVQAISLVVADFNGDGISDVAYAGGPGIEVQFGAIGGTFLTSQYPYTVPDGVGLIYAAALTSPSGLPDLVSDSGGDGGDVSVLLNNGGGSFGTAVAYPVTYSGDMGFGDFDANGATDISVGSQILFNSGAGTFSPAQDVGTPAPSNARIGADLNGDGHADLVIGGDSVELEGASNSGGGGTTGGGGGGTTTSSSGFTGNLTGSAPASTIAGQKAKISQKLALTNSAAFTGSVTGALYLSSDGTVDSNSISLDSQTKSPKLKANARTTFNLKASSIPSSTPNGTYQLIAQITDSSGTTEVTGSSVTVAPAQIDLSGSFSKQPVPGKTGKTALSLSITNSGNTTASGLLKFNIDSSSTNTTTGASVLSSPAKKINLKSGSKPQKISLPTTLPAGTYFLVIQLDPDNAFNDVNPANNIFATSSEITVG